MILPKSNDTELKQLLNDVNQGKIQLPEFQRDWTWDDHRIRGIIASLSEGYPMGAIMQLQYGNPDIRFKYRTLTGVRGVSNEPDYLILDGQQIKILGRPKKLFPLTFLIKLFNMISVISKSAMTPSFIGLIAFT